ncbi:mitochondrial 39-S ribosomal protein L47 (MRP-L47)-domain-containing protein [Radiomyces spectabilis]|uniref:mitochondrial 39-S ribosomal protein L47 (MRP-L47)-domain-containing protein n=1 Tax=Radiomyces spectabilis TaxID=64574 RepID=UPI00221FA86B|nr:mitochondrial 39-S ribosomal protein L47 (MRP-L47)-domain-containing protein [Radiomyces spectabilis]KAI8388236.1 mitochondrial 39-S ribosomal protein L47 (MRP-L47)-domain-containing protein [Radiomyces spectabilis]
MSMLQRLVRAVSGSTTMRSFSTARPMFNESTTTAATNTTPTTNGLYQFFENGQALPQKIWTGRAWKASELRQKSFDDLHKLWYVLLKERNVLATQREEAKRLKIHKQVWSNQGRLKKCQKSMARIKCVLYERQREYESTLKTAVEKN